MTTLPITPEQEVDAERALQIANTIRQQIGLNAWFAVSARRAYACELGTLVFQFGRAGGARREIAVRLTAGDDYTVTVYRTPTRGVNRGQREVLETHEVIYFDMLPDLVRDINERHF